VQVDTPRDRVDRRCASRRQERAEHGLLARRRRTATDRGADLRFVDADDRDAWRDAIVAAVATPRPATSPLLPAGAITWDQHTERLLAVARSVAAS